MSLGNAAIPTKREIEQQVERMLASKLFSSRPRPAEVFRFLIENAIAGTEVWEKDIRLEFFPWPPYKRESTIARTTVNHVRELVSTYYAAEGKDDPVVIDLPIPAPPAGSKRKKIKQPPGKAYRPRFAYNPRNELHQEYVLGVRQLAECSSAGNFFAEDHFLRVVGEKPGHLAGHLGLATVRFRSAICRDGIRESRKKFVCQAEESVRTALRIDPESWHAHALMGAIHCCRWQWDKADEAFAAALKADRAKTCYESWYYPAYLLAVSRTQEALEISATRAASRPDDIMALTAHGIFLYATRDYKGAFRALSDAQRESSNNWLAELFLGLLHMEEPNPIEYVNADLFKNFSRALQWVNVAREDMKSYRFPGITVYAAAHERKTAIAERLLTEFHELATKKHVSSLDWALAFMASRDQVSAIKALSEAHADEDPLLAWLHLWPLLDPLRVRPAFRSLIKRMRLPVSV